MIDEAVFREVLGHYPTGVCVVTGLVDGAPVGMIVGTFTSVSLHPPLVGFMPMRTSSTWQQLATAGGFCINVLSADTEERCRAFGAAPADQRFEQWAWQPSPAGHPILEGAMAWIECRTHQVVEAGDHWIVLGAVEGVEVQQSAPPLLFFQGGYGRFAPLSLVAPADDTIRAGVEEAAVARGVVERLARTYDAECSVIVRISEDALSVVSSATGPSVTTAERLGLRIPLIPPVGDLYAALGRREDAQRWLDRWQGAEPADRERLRERLALVADQGWSSALAKGSQPFVDMRLREALRAYSSGDFTPAQERGIRDVIASTSCFYTADPIDPAARYQVGSLVVPIRWVQGDLHTTLRIGQVPGSLTGAEVQALAADLLTAAEEIRALFLPSVVPAEGPTLVG